MKPKALAIIRFRKNLASRLKKKEEDKPEGMMIIGLKERVKKLRNK